MNFETVIGLEIHVQLSTNSKIFCPSSAAFGADPNEHVDPITFGMPGALPVLNKTVVENAIMMGIAMNCEVNSYNRFARKHYFYPDLPKGYQISQYEEPICERGHIIVRYNGAERNIGINRIHMEEDAGKNIHDMRTQASLVDLNRAGVPLLEIVSEPDIRSPGEAAEYIRTIRQIARYLGISDGNMEEGSLRCDANLSIRPMGQVEFGTRTEVKNINSFKFVERALEYEAARQQSVIKNGGTVVQETLLFDTESGTTRSMRSKEESADYRYFPDPDLPPLVIEESWIRDIRSRMPKLPETRRSEILEVYRLSEYDAGVLTSERAYADYFEKVFEVCSNAKSASNWITSELFGLLKKEGIEFDKCPISAEHLGKLIKLITDEVISGKMGKAVFEEMFYNAGKDPEVIVEEKGLKQITDEAEIEALVEKAFTENQSQLDEYLAGNERLHGFFVGQVMKLSSGNANPGKVNEIIKRKAKERKED